MLGYCRSMASESDVQGVPAAIDDFGSCLAAQDLGGTLALLADDRDVTVIPSEGVETHRGRAAVEAFSAATTARRNATVGVGGIGGSRAWASFVAIGDEFVNVADAERLVIPYCLSGTLVPHDGRWRFLLLHGSEESSGA